MNGERELEGKQGCHCLHKQHDEGGICYTQLYISYKAFVLLCFKLWEDVVGCFLWCWSHFRSCPAAFCKEQLCCQSLSPCRNCCSFLFKNCDSGAGSTQHREDEGEKQAKVGKHVPPLGLTKQGSSQWGHRPTTYKSLCCLGNRYVGKGIFFPCYVFWSQQAMGAIFGHTPDRGRWTEWHESLNSLIWSYLRSYELVPTWKQGITLIFLSKWWERESGYQFRLALT